MKTLLGTEIPETTRGILYLCIFERYKLTVFREILCDSSFDALQLYSNIPNPASQVAMGESYEELIYELSLLHKNMKDEEWLKNLERQL